MKALAQFLCLEVLGVAHCRSMRSLLTGHGIALLLALMLGCSREAPTGPVTTPAMEPLASVMLPAKAGVLAPTHVELLEPYDPAVHAAVDQCEACHSEHVAQWRDSSHHLASFNNPFYRASFEDYVAESGRERAPFCAGCHDPLLLHDDALAAPVSHQDRRAHQGVTCMTCHGAADARSTGVGSYTLDTSTIALPVPGDAGSLERHRSVMSRKALKDDALCVSCHKGFLSRASGHQTFLPALDEHRPWRESSWNGMGAKRITQSHRVQSCRSCHMAQDENGHHSHRFAGGHSTLARAINSDAQLDAVREMTSGRINLILRVSPLSKKPDGNLIIDAIMVNSGVGHRFPGGARDLRDTWVEIVFFDEDGAVLTQSGVRYGSDGDESDVHRLRVGLVDDQGELIETHGVGHFRTPAFDHTIAPDDAAIARYQLERSLAGRVSKISARLQQRRLTPSFYDYACERSKTSHGILFAAASQAFNRVAVDACVTQPVLTLAQAEINLKESSPVADWETLYWHGVGLTHDLQERARYAVATLESALENIPRDIKRPRAMVHSELARALLRAGRTHDALKELRAAEALLPNEPLIFALKAQAMRQTWRLKEMVEPLRKAIELAPADAGLLRELAIAHGSVQEHEKALEAAQRGLALDPRDVDLLRLQMLAYQNLAPQSRHHIAAERVFLEHKRDEKAASLRIACSQTSTECLKEQLPIPTRVLKALEGLDLK